MRWIAVYCPRLALDRLTRSQADPQPLALCDRTQVRLANAAAQALGIQAGMRRATAQALCAGLHIIEQAPREEAEALEQIALWLLQFTPTVSLEPPSGLLLEVEASLRLFGGLDRLESRIRAGLSALGFECRLASAPTAGAAWMLVRGHREDGARIAQNTGLAAGLGPLRVGLLQAAAPHLDALTAIGVRCVGDLARLPRAGLARRWGPALLDELDAALGRRPCVRACIAAPERFSLSLGLLAQVEQAQALLFAGQRLLTHWTGWLAARTAGAQEVWLEALHESGRHAQPPTRLCLKLAEPSRETERWVGVLREQLARTRLPAPVHTLRLSGEASTRLAGHAGELFPRPGSEAEDLGRLIERLQARLGPERVQRLCLAADHRPEAAYRIEPLDPRAPSPALPLPALPRPLWLLPEPVPLSERAQGPWWEGPLTLIAGPERIETGWWDERVVARDYFIAETGSAHWLWIFRTRLSHSEGGWFLQGLFA